MTRGRIRRLLPYGIFFALFVLISGAANDAFRLFELPLKFKPHTQLADFRYLSKDTAFSGFDPLRVIDLSTSQNIPLSANNLCEQLYDRSKWDAGIIPVASFSDYRCPFCRTLSERLYALEASGKIHLRTHEWPILGEASQIFAKAALAAKKQEAYKAAHRHFFKSRFFPTQAYLARSAEELALNSSQFFADMGTTEINDTLGITAQVASQMGLAGTPSIVIGRTIVSGEISERDLRRIVELELKTGPNVGCNPIVR